MLGLSNSHVLMGESTHFTGRNELQQDSMLLSRSFAVHDTYTAQAELQRGPARGRTYIINL